MGRLISFEGGDGAGKSTQIALLATWLREQGREVVQTREPGGTPEGEAVRNLLVSGAKHWDGVAEALLVTAARRHHWRQVIEPAMKAGRFVLCDRFSDSTRAYQGAGRGVPRQVLDQLLELATGGVLPDLTIILDIDPQLGLRRAARRQDSENRFEREAIEFHQRLRDEFLSIAAAEPVRCVVIDASLGIDAIAEQIRSVVKERLL
ncbi:MAG: dTMP kinase [Candidatus Pacebacteria bacterium]|nr:dTMP kinase [Candidatus Paceibacterota bacterium]